MRTFSINNLLATKVSPRWAKFAPKPRTRRAATLMCAGVVIEIPDRLKKMSTTRCLMAAQMNFPALI